MIFEPFDLASAVVFLSKEGNVEREMLFSEFLAVLDRYVPAPELADAHCQAVYVEVDRNLAVKRAVCFKVSFSSDGFIDANWMLPVENLAREADEGPDLGHGPVLLACASQCPVEHYKVALWDPNIGASYPELDAVQRRIEENRLGLTFKSMATNGGNDNGGGQEEAQASQADVLAKHRKKVEQMEKQHGLQIKTLKSDYEDKLLELKKVHLKQSDELRGLLKVCRSETEKERTKNQSLKQVIEKQAKDIGETRSQFEANLLQVKGDEEALVTRLKEKYSLELQAKLEAEHQRVQQELEQLQDEIDRLNHQTAVDAEQIQQLQAQNETLLAESGERLLSRLQSEGISFVAYQPGMGALNLPISEIPTYMSSAILYAAKQCGVSGAHYLAWLRHFRAPICVHSDNYGSICGLAVKKIEMPLDFVPGESDLCHAHKPKK